MGDGELFSTAKVMPYFGGNTAWYRYGEDNSDCGYWGAYATIASDYKTAVVTRAQWEAERAKLRKPKANAQGWIRHRGGKCPVDKGALVDIRARCGEIWIAQDPENDCSWGHDGGDLDIMAYRIHQPEQQYIEKSPDSEMPAAKYFDGPLQWRDRIAEIDAEEARLNTEHRNAIEALEEERVSLVQHLADEGLQLICKKADKVESLPDMSNPDNWKAGDLVVSLKESDDSCFKAGGIYTLREDCECGHVRVKRD